MLVFKLALACGRRVGRWPGAARVQALSWGAALWCLGAAPVFAQSEVVLSLAQAQSMALQRSQAVPAQLLAGQAAGARALAVLRRPDPVLRLGLDNVPVEGGRDSLLTREPTTARSIGIAQALPSADKRSARSDVFQRDAEVARAEAGREARAVMQAAGLAWLEVRAEQLRLDTLEAQLRQASRLQLAAEAAYRAGRGAQTDVFEARLVQARLDDERLRAQSALEQARTTLMRWTGVTAAAQGPVPADLPDWTGAPWAEKPAAALAKSDAEVHLAEAQEAVARAAADASRQDRSADWSVDLRFQQRGPRFDNMVSVGLSIPLRWGPETAQERELEARLAQQQAAQARLEEVRRTRLAEVQRAQQRWRSGLARLRLYDGQRAPLAQAQVQAALGAYRAGTGPLAAVLAAQQAELALQLERVQLELATASDGLRLQTMARPWPEAWPPVTPSHPASHPATQEALP